MFKILLKILRAIRVTQKMTRKFRWDNHLYKYLRDLDHKNIQYRFLGDLINIPELSISITSSIVYDYTYFGNLTKRVLKIYKKQLEVCEIEVEYLFRYKYYVKDCLSNIDNLYNEKLNSFTETENKKLEIKNFLDENTERFKLYCQITTFSDKANFILMTTYENIKDLVEDLNIFISCNANYEYTMNIPRGNYFYNSSIRQIDLDPETQIQVIVSEKHKDTIFNKFRVKIND